MIPLEIPDFTMHLLDILSELASIDKRHNQGNESCRGENNTDDIKTNKSEIESTADAKGADKKAKDQTEVRFPDISDEEFFFKGDAMGGLFFSLKYEPVGEPGNDRII